MPSSRPADQSSTNEQSQSQSMNQTSEPSVQEVRRPDYSLIVKREANLSDDQMRILNVIAEDCMQKVGELDRRAQEIVSARRAAARAGNVQAQQAAPPSELIQLQEQRNNTVRNGIEQIRAQFGSEAFKRFDDYVMNKGGGMRAVLPARGKQPLPVEVTISLLNRASDTSQKQFAANETFVLQVTMLNRSTQMILVRQSEVFAWLQLSSNQGRESIETLMLFLRRPSGSPPMDTTIDLPPGQLILVGQKEIGPDGLKLPPGKYRISFSRRVLLNRPPNDSEFLDLLPAGEATAAFEILP